MTQHIMDWLWVIFMSVGISFFIYTAACYLWILFDIIAERRERRERRKNHNRRGRKRVE